MKQFYALVLLAVTIVTASAANPLQLRYEPNKVCLTGTVRIVVFPGRPNYENIADGDEPEAVLILTLDTPVDVIEDAVPSDGMTEGVFNLTTYTNITAIHVVDVNDQVNVRENQRLRVRVKGVLMEGHTGHHHTEVLLWADQIDLLKTQPETE